MGEFGIQLLSYLLSNVWLVEYQAKYTFHSYIFKENGSIDIKLENE